MGVDQTLADYFGITGGKGVLVTAVMTMDQRRKLVCERRRDHRRGR